MALDSLHNTTFKLFWLDLTVLCHCTVVKKGNIIHILDYELGVFSETLELEKNWTKRVFGLSLHRKKF